MPVSIGTKSSKMISSLSLLFLLLFVVAVESWCYGAINNNNKKNRQQQQQQQQRRCFFFQSSPPSRSIVSPLARRLPVSKLHINKIEDDEEETTEGDMMGDENFIEDDEECWDLCDTEDDEILIGSSSTTMSSDVEDATAATQRARTRKEEVRKMDERRVSLEMQWELTESQQECEVMENVDTCAQTCQACSGSGRIACRFCQGSKVITLPTSAGPPIDCPVCNREGHEVCTSCRGTGYRAQWTTLADYYPK